MSSQCKLIHRAVSDGLYRREMIGFWHVVSDKLCLPSQYAEEFADLSSPHTICRSSDFQLRKTRDVLQSHSGAVHVPVARDFHLHLVSKYISIACLWVSDLHQNKCVIFGVYHVRKKKDTHNIETWVLSLYFLCNQHVWPTRYDDI